MKTVLAMLAALALSGCATVVISDTGGKTIADITNTGWFMFNSIPIACGNPSAPNENSCRLFKNTTTLKNNIALLDYAATKAGATGACSIVSYTTDESIFMILLKRHACHTSAELVFDGQGRPPGASNRNGMPECELQSM